MAASTPTPKTDTGPIAGFYIARHPWLGRIAGDALHKVGHTGDLRARLQDDAYVTCYPPGWTFAATFETPDKETAWLLESAVLDCVGAARLAPRELVALTADQIRGIARAAAGALGIEATERTTPEYVARTRARVGGTSGGSGTGEAALYSAEARGKVAHLRIETAPATLATLMPATPAAPRASVPAATATLAAEIVERAAALQKLKPGRDEIFDDTRIDAPPPELENFVCEARDYQQEAITDSLAMLNTDRRAILQMACRSGKTFVAWRVLREYLAGAANDTPHNVLFLVPSLGLLAQTAQKLMAYAAADGRAFPTLFVGSDTRPIPLPGGRAQPMTTDPAAIAEFLGGEPGRLVISTYHSSPLLPDVFGLAVFDEAHRTTGPRKVGHFNYVLLNHTGPRRLFMTATPVFGKKGTDLMMSDESVYGRVAYHYHLRRGIAAGYITDFRLVFVGGDATAEEADEAAALAGAKRAKRAKKPAGEPASGEPATGEPVKVPKVGYFGSPKTLARQIVAAMGQIDRLLVFSLLIADARDIAREVETLVAAGALGGVAPFDCVLAHSNCSDREKSESLARLSAGDGRRVALFNCKMYQEGTEVPPLQGVFFACPRSSLRDIIQILCRPLNRYPGKEIAYVFIPVLAVAGEDLNSPAALGRFAATTPIIDALLKEDPALYNHLLDPSRDYPLEWIEAGGPAAAGLSPDRRRALLQQIRRVTRSRPNSLLKGADTGDRILAIDQAPWDVIVEHIRDFYVGRLRRYPKTTSKDFMPYGEIHINISNWMSNVRARWHGWGSKKLSAKERRDLAALPGWAPYGEYGPYPAQECLNFLEHWLETHDGVPPLVEINRGGFVGLDATPMERLSGLLMQVNQNDYSGVMTKPVSEMFSRPDLVGVPGEIARIAARFGLVWPKPRRPDGRTFTDSTGKNTPVQHMTFIQKANYQFKCLKERAARLGQTDPYIAKWFPGYPEKHYRQETLETIRTGIAPKAPPGSGKRKKKRAANKRAPIGLATAAAPAVPYEQTDRAAAARARGLARRAS